MRHIVLLGDSIFDNAAYVRGGFPIIQQLRLELGAETYLTWRWQQPPIDLTIVSKLPYAYIKSPHLHRDGQSASTP